jgi:hypothetical protein
VGLFGRILGLDVDVDVEPVVRRQTLTFKGPLEMRDGHPVLSDEMRQQLESAGLDPAQVEAQLAATPGAGGSSESVSTSVSGSASIRDQSGHAIRLHGGLEIRRGHPVMNDELRAELERRGIDPALVETQLDRAGTGQSQWQASYTPSGELRSCSFSENGVTGSFEIRSGLPVLTAESRAELEGKGEDAGALEAAFQARVEVNEFGKIVARTQPAPTAEQSGAEPAQPFFRKPSEEDLLRPPGSQQDG